MGWSRTDKLPYWLCSRCLPAVSAHAAVCTSGYDVCISSLLTTHTPTSLTYHTGDTADHSITNRLMSVIWSFGQVYPDYFHNPGSGIEAGTAQNNRFYQPDEIKYHGGRNRGATSLNFFGKQYAFVCVCVLWEGGRREDTL